MLQNWGVGLIITKMEVHVNAVDRQSTDTPNSKGYSAVNDP